MDKPKTSERARYWFDNLMSRGTIALMGLLALATVLLVVVVSVVVWVFRAFPDNAEEGDFIDIGVPEEFDRAQQLIPAWHRR